MAKRTWPWLKDLLVFAAMTALNIVLIVPCGLVLTLSDSPKKGLGISDAWYWVFLTPAMAANELGWRELAWPLVWVNPVLYGGAWWLLWRMYRLMRSQPPKDDPPTSDRA